MAIKPKVCVVCGTIYQPRSWSSAMTPMCSAECKAARRAERAKVVETTCYQCGRPVACTGPIGLQQARKGRAYCSDACRDMATSRMSSERMADTNRRHASARMKANNPMADDATREKMRETILRVGHKPKVRGGNGRPAPEPQRRLAEALGWEMEFVVPTKVPRINPLMLPLHYKIDIANPDLMIAIEVDGGSHGGQERRKLDAKKDAFLRSRGWTVLRFSNREVMADTEACARTVTSTTSRSRTTTTTSSTAS